jgi:diguanylate cyclase (GGDEF)-like protein/PAS domain S-box-containing protein
LFWNFPGASGLQRLSANGLIRWATAFVVLACAAVFVGGLIPDYFAYHALQQRVEEETSSLARLFLQHAEDTLAMADGNLLVLRNVIESGIEPAAAIAQIAALKGEGRPSVHGLTYAYVLPTGDALVARDTVNIRRSPVVDTALFEQLKTAKRRDVVIGEPVVDPAIGRALIAAGRRVTSSDGGFAGTVTASVDVDALTQFFAETATSRRMSVTLTRDDSVLLARYPAVDGRIGTPVMKSEDFYRSIVRRGAGILRATSPFDGIARIIAYHASEQYGLVASVSVASDDVVAEWLWPAVQRAAMRLLTTLVIAAVGLWGLRQMRLQAHTATLLAKREAEFRMLVEGARDPILLLDTTGIIRYASPAALVLFERPPEDLVGNHIAALASAQDAPSVLIALGALRLGAGAGSRIGFHYDSALGGRRWYVMAVQTTVQDGEHSIVATLRDETEEQRRQQTLAREASTDPLSGLANRRHFDRALETEWRRAARGRTPLSLVMVDVDRFKAYNDTYGHARGDLCLATIAKVLQETARRAGEVVARIGGEEFAVLMPRADATAAVELAERVRAAVADRDIAHKLNLPSGVVTISAGVATLYPAEVPTLTCGHLVDRADKALYAAKHGGRNQVATIPTPDEVAEPKQAATAEA